MISLDVILQWLKANYMAAIVAWILLNLLIFVFVSAFFDWYFSRKNRKTIGRYLIPSAKSFLMARQKVEKEEDLDCKHSLLEALFMAGSGYALSVVSKFLIEGPHIKDIKGIFNSEKWFDFALFFVGPNYKVMSVSTSSHLGIFLLHGICFQLSIIFWGLLPYVFAALLHYNSIKEYALRFDKAEEDRLIEEGRIEFVVSVKCYNEILKQLADKQKQ
jgi:hypothetical protein